ncbi:HU family DNA-binding protein [Amycolatopsis pigmentata]|uniref:HU family DNA-binding protein n=1 Tax=Amycolatopsis pigmentata TaxID=450801 RepID=A0ABW5G3P7_9PSEU
MANKAQLIEALSERLGDKKVASEAVDGLVDIIIRTVNKGEKVNITGFGVFEKRARAARTARNPRTGETVRVKKTNVPAFRAGTTFKDVISGAKKLPKATAVKRSTGASTRGTGTTTRATASRTTSRATTTRPTATRSTTTRTRAAAATKAAPKPAAKTTAAKATTAKKPATTKAAAAKTTAKPAASRTAAKKPAATTRKKK